MSCDLRGQNVSFTVYVFFVTMVFCKNYFLEAKIYILEHLSDFDSVFKLYEIQ